jgi:hypothetical protein
MDHIMKTVTITQQQWSELNVNLLYTMAKYLADEHSEGLTREERTDTNNMLNDALYQYKKIKEAFQS